MALRNRRRDPVVCFVPPQEAQPSCSVTQSIRRARVDLVDVEHRYRRLCELMGSDPYWSARPGQALGDVAKAVEAFKTCVDRALHDVEEHLLKQARQ